METTDDRQPGSHHANPPPGGRGDRLDRHAGRHEIPTHDYEPDGIFQEGRAASPAATTPIPLPRASLSFIVKQPGGLGYKPHSKCSKKNNKNKQQWKDA